MVQLLRSILPYIYRVCYIVLLFFQLFDSTSILFIHLGYCLGKNYLMKALSVTIRVYVGSAICVVTWLITTILPRYDYPILVIII